jgi:membrane protein DedA with SNARE-associated domain
MAGMGVPLPEDIPLLTGGWLCYNGLATLWVMVVIALIGVLGGDLILFTLGRRFGHHVVEHRFIRRLVNADRLLLAENLFAQHGNKIIFAGRFLPGLRPMIFMAAGVLKVRPGTFLTVDGLAAAISVPTLVILGFLFGQHFNRIKQDVRFATHTIALVLVVVGLIVLAIYLYRRQKGLMAMMAGHHVDRDRLAEIPEGADIDSLPENHRSIHLNVEIPEPADTPSEK